MKNIIILSVIVSVSALFAHSWTNATGSQDFNDPLNWFDLPSNYVFSASDNATVNKSGSDAAILSSDAIRGDLDIVRGLESPGEVFITGGTNSFVNLRLGYGQGVLALLDVSGGETSFSGFATIANTGYGRLNVSDGILNINRMQFSQNASSSSDFIMRGGEINITRYLYIGNGGQSQLTMTGGILNVNSEPLRLGRLNKSASGIIDLSGDAIVNALFSYTNIGEEGYAAVYISDDAVMNVDRIQLATISDPNSQGYIYMTGGELNVNGEYFIVGKRGQAGVEVSGGAINADAILLGEGATGETYQANGYLLVSDSGVVNLDNYLEVGSVGTGLVRLEGDSAQINPSQLTVAGNGIAEFVLNGSAGVGRGMTAFGGTSIDQTVHKGSLQLNEGAAVDALFIDGTEVAGDYVVIASSGRVSYLPSGEIIPVSLPAGDASDFLSADSQTAGWGATIYDAGTGSAFVVTSPVNAPKAAWTSAGANDVAVLDDDNAALNSAKAANGAVVGETATASLDVTTGADGQFVNLTIGEEAGSAGTVSVSGGSVAVDSVAYIGKQGSATLDISGGSFETMNLLAATGDTASSDIKISGSASFAANNLLALTAGSKLTISGYQASATVGNLSLDKNADIVFELDETHGVGTGLIVEGNAVLKGKISLVPLDQRIDATYTVLRCSGDIYIETESLIKTSFVNYEIVENGEYKELQVTFFTPDTCEEVVEGGFSLLADMNNDCYVNIEDIAIVATQWLVCNNPQDSNCDVFQN